MSRIGRQPVSIPDGVAVSIGKSSLVVKGPKGELDLDIPNKIKVELVNNQVIIKRLSEEKKTKSLHGTIRSLIENMTKGVTELWKKELEVRGTGYKAVLSGSKLVVNAGFIHTVDIDIPQGINIDIHKETEITVSGCDKTLVGQIASNIRKIRKPEPYKGKGIRYKNEYIKLKPGKTAKA
ncbi:50S ribosomal protein L6 [Patescibacteria group bacterium]|nr:50S ribosomal protein L6 [Patescibacteria group bacterium]